MSDVQDAAERIKATTSRIDAFFAEQAETERRRVEDDRRSQAQIDAEANRQAQIKYDDQIFSRYDERCPMPQAEQSPASYARQLMRSMQKKLSPSDDRVLSSGATVAEIARAPVGEMNASLRALMEPQFFEAGLTQAEHPHVSTLPTDGSFAERVKVDENTGVKERRFFRRESFIKDFTVPGKRVVGFRPQGINGPLINSSGVPVVLRER